LASQSSRQNFAGSSSTPIRSGDIEVFHLHPALLMPHCRNMMLKSFKVKDFLPKLLLSCEVSGWHRCETPDRFLEASMAERLNLTSRLIYAKSESSNHHD
jgi:hypothetical protein